MEDVIVVTINYRLHALGFACIPEMGIYGNAGLKDQQLALEWIYENIEYFGGDITNITLFGESAGATSAHLHSLNPKSKQYFHKMILQSGSALCDWLIQADGEEKMKNLVKIMKGRNDTPKDTYESLMKIEAKKFFDHRVNCQNAEEKRRAIPVILKPVIEKESDEAFLTKLPIELICEQGKDLNIPIMIGFNNGDGMVQMEYFYDKLDKADRNLLYFVPTSIKVEQESEEAKEIEHEMRKFFFGDLGLVRENIPALNNLGTDLHYTVQTTLFNEMYRKYSPNTKQYVYQFCLDTKLNIGKSFSRARNCSGAFHTDELSYLFE
jgi:acetylcholinesterase